MAQNVDMIIEVRGGAGHKHLHLKIELNTISIATAIATDGLVNWRVSLDSGVSASSIGLSAVTLWFPYTPPIFVQTAGSDIADKEVVIALAPTGPSVVPGSNLLGSDTLIVNKDFPLPALLPRGKFAVPIGIYCTVDGGQDTGPGSPPKDFFQPGRQMIDGKNSHPECNVGP